MKYFGRRDEGAEVSQYNKYLLVLLMAVSCCGTVSCTRRQPDGIIGEEKVIQQNTGGTSAEEVSTEVQSGEIADETDINYGEYYYQENLEKYDIGETNAFYILPTNIAMPDGLLRFELIDFRDDNTTVYAYQALYSDKKEALADPPREDNAYQPQDSEEWLAVPARDSKEAFADPAQADKMVTVFMSYQPEEQKYKVFGIWVDDIEAVYTTSGSGEQILTVNVKDGRGASESQMETNTFYAQKLSGIGGDKYMFYYQQHMYFYEASGKLMNNNNLKNVLDALVGKYGDQDAQYTVSKALADINSFAYLLLTIEKDGKEIDENTQESDLEAEDSIVQILLYVFYLDIGGDKNRFVSKNQNYETQAAAWKEDDGKVIDLGVWEQEEEPGFGDVSDQVIDSAAVVDEYPNTFGSYQFMMEEEMLELYATPKIESDRMSWDAANEALQKMQSVMPDTENLEEKQYWCKILGKDEKTVSASALAVTSGDYPGEREEIFQTETKTVTVRWRREKEQETQESQEIQETEYKEHELRITLETDFLRQYETFFPEDAKLEWGENRISQDDIAPGIRNSGIVRYHTTEALETVIQYESSGTAAEIFECMINGNAGSAYVIDARTQETQDKENILYVGTGKNMILLRQSAFQEGAADISTAYQVANTELQFGSISQADDANSFLSDSDSAKADADITVTGADTSDRYMPQGMQIIKSGGIDWLYVAGADNGIVRYNLGAADTDCAAAGQICAYPGYAVRVHEDTCSVIGYPTSAYQYNNEDLAFAKLFTVSTADAAAFASLVSSALEKDTALYADIAEEGIRGGRSTWNTLLKNLGVDTADGGNMQLVNEYYGLLVESERAKREAIDKFFTIACGTVDTLTEQEREAVKRQLEQCYYADDIEVLIVEQIHLLNPVIDKTVEKQESIETAKKQESAEPAERVRKDYEEQLYSSEVLEAVQKQAGYDIRDDALWEQDMQNIASSLHPEVTLGEAMQRLEKKQAERNGKEK